MRTEDLQLLRDYAENGSEAAFTELVTRHLDLVHSVACRQLDDADRARDVSQLVFSDLARKAGAFPSGMVLPAWLHRAAVLAARQVRRSEYRRRRREQLAMELNPPPDSHRPASWSAVIPLLDEALNELGRTDRDALILRFFGPSDLRAVGRALGISDDAAQKRVARALDRLREQLEKRGVTSTAAALAAGLAGEAVAAAPAGLAPVIVTSALAAAASGGTAFSLLTLMSSLNLKLGAGAVLALALVTPLVLQYREINRLRRETLALRQDLARMESRPAKPLVPSPEEEAARRADRVELLRLRGEVAQWRRADSRPSAVPTGPGPAAVQKVPTLAMSRVEGVVAPGGAVLTGGWVTGPGRWAFLMVTPQPEDLGAGYTNVRLLTRLIEADEAVLTSQGLDLTQPMESDDGRLRLTAVQSADLINSLESTEGVQVGQVTEVSTTDGTTGKFAWTQSDRPDALDIQVLPIVNPADGSVRLAIDTREVPIPPSAEGSAPSPGEDGPTP